VTTPSGAPRASAATSDAAALRALVRDVVRDVVREGLPELLAARRDPAGESTRLVRLRDDAELDAFVQDLLQLLADPARRDDVRSGRLRFRLAPAGSPEPGAGTYDPTRGRVGADLPARPGEARPGNARPGNARHGERRIEAGAVTERVVAEAAAAGVDLVLGPRAVLTPLARDRARSAGVAIVRPTRPTPGTPRRDR
jgi:hypothetical protein